MSPPQVTPESPNPSGVVGLVVKPRVIAAADANEVMREQLDAILLASLASHIEVGVVPACVMIPASTGFRLLDDHAVFVELDTREVVIREPEEVARYLDIFERLRARAVRGAELAELVRGIASDLADRTAGEHE